MYLNGAVGLIVSMEICPKYQVKIKPCLKPPQESCVLWGCRWLIIRHSFSKSLVGNKRWPSKALSKVDFPGREGQQTRISSWYFLSKKLEGKFDSVQYLLKHLTFNKRDLSQKQLAIVQTASRKLQVEKTINIYIYTHVESFKVLCSNLRWYQSSTRSAWVAAWSSLVPQTRDWDEPKRCHFESRFGNDHKHTRTKKME